MNFGEILSKLRDESGLTQKQVGEQLGYRGGSFISHLERGSRQPPQEPEFYSQLGATLNLEPVQVNRLISAANPLSSLVITSGISGDVSEILLNRFPELFQSDSPLIEAAYYLRDNQIPEQDKATLRDHIESNLNLVVDIWERHRPHFRSS